MQVLNKPTIIETVRLNRLHWFGHVQRMEENRIPKRVLYEGCPESIQPFWISREPVTWPWCNLAASQMRPYCAAVNSHSAVGLVIRQWDAIDWACVLCDHHIHKSPPFQWWFQLWEKPELTGSQIWAVGRLTDLCDVMLCQKSLDESCRMGRRIVLMKLIYLLRHCECDGHTDSVNGVSLPTD